MKSERCGKSVQVQPMPPSDDAFLGVILWFATRLRAGDCATSGDGGGEPTVLKARSAECFRVQFLQVAKLLWLQLHGVLQI